ncbi:MAG: hypothetical protein ACT4O3_08315 [Elusimicrobiota bacterium]
MDQKEPTREQLTEALEDANRRLAELEGRLSESKDDALWLEGAIRKRTRQLNERVKELDCLYRISALLDDPNLPLPAVLGKLVEDLPSAWQYPGRACARAVVGNQVVKTPGFQETPWRQACDITVDGRRAGTLEVRYLSLPPEGPAPLFLSEEETLLKEISRRLGRLIALRTRS